MDDRKKIKVQKSKQVQISTQLESSILIFFFYNLLLVIQDTKFMTIYLKSNMILAVVHQDHSIYHWIIFLLAGWWLYLYRPVLRFSDSLEKEIFLFLERSIVLFRGYPKYFSNLAHSEL